MYTSFMITPAMERAAEFLDSSESYSTDSYVIVEQSKLYFEELIKNSIRDLFIGQNKTIRVFTAEHPAKDTEAQYGKWLAWYSHIESEGEKLQDAYYGASPYSPLFGSAEHIEECIKSGRLHESDKDLWEIMFKHPKQEYFYIVKYLPGEDGFGFGYRVSVSNDWENYNATMESIESGSRYNFET